MIVSVNRSIKFKNKFHTRQFKLSDLVNLNSWLELEFPNEYFTLHEFCPPVGSPEYYLETSGSQTSLLLLYFVLNSFHEGVMIKNPLGMNSMTSEVRAKVYRQFLDSR